MDAYADEATVEIADEDGVTLDLLTLPYMVLSPVEVPEQRHFAF